MGSATNIHAPGISAPTAAPGQQPSPGPHSVLPHLCSTIHLNLDTSYRGVQVRPRGVTRQSPGPRTLPTQGEGLSEWTRTVMVPQCALGNDLLYPTCSVSCALGITPSAPAPTKCRRHRVGQIVGHFHHLSQTAQGAAGHAAASRSRHKPTSFLSHSLNTAT